MFEIIPIGIHRVIFGDKEDPKRIKKMIGNFQHYLGSKLDPHFFTGIDSWPEGDRDFELFMIGFKKDIPNFEAMLDEASVLPANLRPAGFAHLATHFCKLQTKALHSNFNTSWLVVSDPASLWQPTASPLSVPLLNCNPGYTSIDRRRTTELYGENDYFLFYSDYIANAKSQSLSTK